MKFFKVFCNILIGLSFIGFMTISVSWGSSGENKNSAPVLKYAHLADENVPYYFEITDFRKFFESTIESRFISDNHKDLFGDFLKKSFSGKKSLKGLHHEMFVPPFEDIVDSGLLSDVNSGASFPVTWQFNKDDPFSFENVKSITLLEIRNDKTRKKILNALSRQDTNTILELPEKHMLLIGEKETIKEVKTRLLGKSDLPVLLSTSENLKSVSALYSKNGCFIYGNMELFWRMCLDAMDNNAYSVPLPLNPHCLVRALKELVPPDGLSGGGAWLGMNNYESKLPGNKIPVFAKSLFGSGGKEILSLHPAHSNWIVKSMVVGNNIDLIHEKIMDNCPEMVLLVNAMDSNSAEKGEISNIEKFKKLFEYCTGSIAVGSFTNQDKSKFTIVTMGIKDRSKALTFFRSVVKKDLEKVSSQKIVESIIMGNPAFGFAGKKNIIFEENAVIIVFAKNIQSDEKRSTYEIYKNILKQKGAIDSSVAYKNALSGSVNPDASVVAVFRPSNALISADHIEKIKYRVKASKKSEKQFHIVKGNLDALNKDIMNTSELIILSITRTKTSRNSHANIGIADFTALKAIGDFECRNQLKNASKLINKKEMVAAAKELRNKNIYLSIWNLKKIVDEPSVKVLEALGEKGVRFEKRQNEYLLKLYDPKKEQLDIIAKFPAE